jgi:LPXTG-site transpeptidase (sortase) family protein
MSIQQKTAIKVFAILFLFSFLAINWNDVSWLFNYKEIDGLVYDFFNPYQDSNLLVGVDAFDDTGNLNGNFLRIPVIGLYTPVMIGESTDKTALARDLDRGAVYYPGSVQPGQKGQIVILGHSAPPNWPRIRHDYIFSNLESLKAGDEITFNFDHQIYTYIVTDKHIVEAGQDISNISLSGSQNVLTLVSCWPPGENYQRITVNAELKIL